MKTILETTTGKVMRRDDGGYAIQLPGLKARKVRPAVAQATVEDLEHDCNEGQATLVSKDDDELHILLRQTM